jgi:hypothetical protein
MEIHKVLVGTTLIAGIGAQLAVKPAPKHVSLLLILYSLPWWLPKLVLKARFWVFSALNGEEGLEFPSETVNGEAMKWLYNHKDASIRSRQLGVGISGST